jgi:DNA polymerase-4
MESLPVEKFHGVGKVTAAKMKTMGLYTGADLKKLSKDELIQPFGKVGHFYYQIVRGIDERPVQTNRETKSLAAENTFAYDLTTMAEMETEPGKIALPVHNRLVKNNLAGRTITLKIKYSDFKQITRNKSFAAPVVDLATIRSVAKQLLAATDPEGKKIRLLGISISNFGETSTKQPGKLHNEQLKLF